MFDKFIWITLTLIVITTTILCIISISDFNQIDLTGVVGALH